MAENNRKGALALIAAGAIAVVGGICVVDQAHAEEAVRRPVAGTPAARGAVRHRALRTAAAERPLTIRRRAAPVGPVDVVGDGFYGDDYLVRQHSWNDPRLYYFGPFRTGGEVFYGDQAGNPITRGNAGLGQIAGYGGARGGFGGPHFDSVGGFHQGPGPDAKIDSDYASGSLSRPYYGDIEPRYPSVSERVASLNTGVVTRPAGVTNAALDRAESRRVMTEGSRNGASFEQAKADFAAPMKRQAPIEAGFANGGIRSIGIDDGAF